MSELDAQYYQMLLISDLDHYLCSSPEDLRDYTWEDSEALNNTVIDTSGYESGANVDYAIQSFLDHCSEELLKFKLEDKASSDVVFVGVREVRQPDWIIYRCEPRTRKPAEAMDGAQMRYTSEKPMELKEVQSETIEAICQEQDLTV